MEEGGFVGEWRWGGRRPGGRGRAFVVAFLAEMIESG